MSSIFFANFVFFMKVIFESERGTGDDKNRIDTQLDDIKFQNGKCEKCKQHLVYLFLPLSF